MELVLLMVGWRSDTKNDLNQWRMVASTVPSREGSPVLILTRSLYPVSAHGMLLLVQDTLWVTYIWASNHTPSIEWCNHNNLHLYRFRRLLVVTCNILYDIVWYNNTERWVSRIISVSLSSTGCPQWRQWKIVVWAQIGKTEQQTLLVAVPAPRVAPVAAIYMVPLFPAGTYTRRKISRATPIIIIMIITTLRGVSCIGV